MVLIESLQFEFEKELTYDMDTFAWQSKVLECKLLEKYCVEYDIQKWTEKSVLPLDLTNPLRTLPPLKLTYVHCE
jgi:hypothetical protein